MRSMLRKRFLKAAIMLLAIWQFTVFCLPFVHRLIVGPEDPPPFYLEDKQYISSLLHPNASDIEDSLEFANKLNENHQVVMSAWRETIQKNLNGLSLDET